jgi:hypothetical protein
VTLEEFTKGTVQRSSYALSVSLYPFALSHSVLINTSTGLSDLIADITQRQAGLVYIWMSPSPCSAGYDRWAFTLYLDNYGSSAVYLEDVTLDIFDGDGDWTNVCWYAPDGAGPFPHSYQTLGRWLYAGDEYEGTIETYYGDYIPISNLVTYQQTGSTVVTVRYTVDGTEYLATDTLTRTYNGHTPASPDVRRYPLGNPNAALRLLPLTKAPGDWQMTGAAGITRRLPLNPERRGIARR